MIICFEGPEKAGKTTLIESLKKQLDEMGIKTRVRKFSGPMTGEEQYLEPLQEDLAQPYVVSLWDRAWVSEYVYSTYFKRDSILRDNAQRAEDIFTAALGKQGLKVIVLPHDVQVLKTLRDSTDLDIDPIIETAMFQRYALDHKWLVFLNFYTEDSLLFNKYFIVSALIDATHHRHD